MKNRRLWTGLAFISPWLIGFVVLTIYPLISVAYDSLCDYSVLTPGYLCGGEKLHGSRHRQLILARLGQQPFLRGGLSSAKHRFGVAVIDLA